MGIMDSQFYKLKIELIEIEPEIWRRFVVPADIYLDQLHYVIQKVMGWDDAHLYLFTIQRKEYPGNPFEEDHESFNAQDYQLNDLVRRKGAKIYYLYDYGDRWEHELVVENSRYVNTDLDQLYFCLDGKRACPREDIGGWWEYVEYCRMLNDPKLKAKEEEYLGTTLDFDPEHFDLEEINSRLK
ncbi:MAG: plasmid pRiA4b ORF-3 family protein [Rhodobacteraceae bacterium]|nr:plasmid pRiA4b ORF-3 family protein [Paracoccaceae bacterium]